MKITPAATFLVIAAVLAFVTPARGQGLIVDLSKHHVAITTGFTGADVLLFGAVEGEGDIVVVITGPRETVVVRHKQRIAGIWVNADNVAFEGVPNFYAVASTKPLSEIATPDIREGQQIGADNIIFQASEKFQDWRPQDLAPFREALIRNKQKDGLYSSEPTAVTVIGNRLFRTRVHFPANMATGSYTAVVYLFREGDAVQAVSTPILVEKVGVGAEVFNFAHQQSALYGIGAIVVAVAAGWFAAAVFRKI